MTAARFISELVEDRSLRKTVRKRRHIFSLHALIDGETNCEFSFLAQVKGNDKNEE